MPGGGDAINERPQSGRFASDTVQANFDAPRRMAQVIASALAARITDSLSACGGTWPNADP